MVCVHRRISKAREELIPAFYTVLPMRSSTPKERFQEVLAGQLFT